MNIFRKLYSKNIGIPIWVGKVINKNKTLREIHHYWRNPNDLKNCPTNYFEGKDRSEYLVKLIKQYAGKRVSVLEIGCNVGRNLFYLDKAGFRNLTGIEISRAAVDLMKKHFHKLFSTIKIYNRSVEQIIKKFDNHSFGVVYTMAVLEHIHSQSEWVFSEMARILGKYIITIEDEHGISWRHFPRNYKMVFEKFGFEQIFEDRSVVTYGLDTGFVTRVFKRL